MDFTYPYWEESLGVLVRKVDDSDYMGSLFRPYNFWVWWTIVGATVGIALLMWFFGQLGPKDPVAKNFSSCMWYSATTFLTQSKISLKLVQYVAHVYCVSTTLSHST